MCLGLKKWGCEYRCLTCSMLTMGTEGDLAHPPGLAPASLLITRGV